MIIVLLLIIAVALILLVSRASEQTAAVKRMEIAQHNQQYPDIPGDVIELAKQGKRIEAAKLYREKTNCSVEIALAKITPLLPRSAGLVSGAGWAIVAIAFVVIIIGLLFAH